jgi:hypothetical protein
LLTLLSTNDAAQKLGISVQGVHYRIKTNKLKSIQKDGKTFVYLDIEEEKAENFQNSNNHQLEIIKVKDEQIGFLKKAIRWMTFQHKNELQRMEQTHNKIIDVFKSEVELLQRAYNEMQTLYKTQQSVEYQKEETPQSNLSKTKVAETVIKNDGMMAIEEFLLFLRRKGKSNNQIKQILYDAIKSGDSRFKYNPIRKTISVMHDSFQDLI